MGNGHAPGTEIGLGSGGSAGTSGDAVTGSTDGVGLVRLLFAGVVVFAVFFFAAFFIAGFPAGFFLAGAFEGLPATFFFTDFLSVFFAGADLRAAAFLAGAFFLRAGAVFFTVRFFLLTFLLIFLP